ncbi:MBL fold metallo-hydrolase [Nibrella saemangeumensis]|uniref:MBL fold metallo-hydrolase n=1 Tax=Nibrella saemangeumensis TaxID=1084526 RepID=A0ABP8ND54_9BACT
MNTTTGTATGTITKLEKGPYTIHSYLSPESAEMVCTQIIETPSSLVVVDAQLLRSQALEVKSYIESLGKPIHKFIISHCHPDHWAGLEVFPDAPVYARSETIFEIQNYGQGMLDSKTPQFGDAVTKVITMPTNVLDIESEELDGLQLNYVKLTDTESVYSVMIKIPQLKVLIAQDTVYNGVYPYFGDRDYYTKAYCFDTWTAILEELKAEGYEVIFPGHGLPTDASALDRMIDYLSFVKLTVLSTTDGNEMISKIMTHYPGYKIPDMLYLSSFMLYNAQG